MRRKLSAHAAPNSAIRPVETELLTVSGLNFRFNVVGTLEKSFGG